MDKLIGEADAIYRNFLENTRPVDNVGESSLQRVVGGTEAQRATIRTASDIIFSSHEFAELENKERDKTPEDQYIISLVVQEINSLRQKYGLKELELSDKNIHFISPSAWPRALSGSEGGFNAYGQTVLIKDTRLPLDKARYVFHESVHFASFFSMDADSATSGAQPSRHGLAIIAKNGREHFTWLNEAVTEELSKRFTEKNADDLIFKKSVLTQEFILPLKRFNYPEERRALQLLCEELSNRLPERFKGSDDAFDLFVRSMFTGQILELARVIEEAFGRGAFRRLRRPLYGQNASQLVKKLIRSAR